MGVDVNGRFDLHAFDDLIQYDLAGNIISTRPNVSVDNARRTDTGVFASLDTSLARLLAFGAGVRGDYVTTQNSGGYFGDQSTGNGDFSGYASLTAGSFGGLTATVQIARGFRDPVLSDRYYRGPTGRGFITGNPDLVPETSLQFDGSVRYQRPGSEWERSIISTGSTTSSSGIRPQPTSSSSATAGALVSAGSRWRRRPHSATR